MNKKHPYGFTLIELILYIALISIFMGGAIMFSWDVIYGARKSNIQMDVNENIRFAAKRISYETRNASGINNLSTNSLCLSSGDPARNPTEIYTNGNQIWIAWGGGSSDCTNMANEEPITSNNLTSVINFINRSVDPISKNVEYSITITSTGARQEWQHSETLNTVSEIRSN